MKLYNFPDQINGDSFEARDVLIKNKETQTPLNISNCQIKCQFRKETKTGLVVETLEVGSGLIISDGVNGVFTINRFITDWGAGIYYYDFEFVFENGKKITYFGGYMKLIQDVTT